MAEKIKKQIYNLLHSKEKNFETYMKKVLTIFKEGYKSDKKLQSIMSWLTGRQTTYCKLYDKFKKNFNIDDADNVNDIAVFINEILAAKKNGKLEPKSWANDTTTAKILEQLPAKLKKIEEDESMADYKFKESCQELIKSLKAHIKGIESNLNKSKDNLKKLEKKNTKNPSENLENQMNQEKFKIEALSTASSGLITFVKNTQGVLNKYRLDTIPQMVIDKLRYFLGKLMGTYAGLNPKDLPTGWQDIPIPKREDRKKLNSSWEVLE